MQHLKILKILNYVNAGLMVLGIVIVLLSLAFSMITFLSVGVSEVMAALVITVVIDVLCILLLVVLGALYVRLAGKIEKGEGRIMQTVFAVLAVGNCPFGTAYAGYALWVCWLNEETVAIFAGEQAPE
jgi:hypothetical protein